MAPLMAMAGCVTGLSVPPAGRVMGGQQAVAGATIQLYAVGTTGDASAATPLLNPALVTDAHGYFSLYGNFTCPAPGAMTYLTATGGSPGLGSRAVNPNLLLMAAIGRCDTAAVLNPPTIDEVTTVAAVQALAPWMASATQVGSSPVHAGSLQYSFFNASEMARLEDGTSPGDYLAPGDLAPSSVIDTLADVLAACVNSPGGVAGDGSSCGQLFSETGGAGVHNTLDALLALAANPTANTVALFNLAPAAAPFQPQLALPPVDFRIGIYHPSAVQVLPAAGLTYANQGVGSTSAAQAVSITNGGSTAVTIASASIAGATAQDFAVTGNCLGALAPGAACTLRVAFSPTAIGRRSAYLTVATGGTASDPNALPLLGTAN